MPDKPSTARAASGSLQQLLAQAMNLARQGRISEAERIYSEVLAQQPSHFDALHHLGLIRMQQGRLAEALRLIGAAVDVRPEAVEAILNLASVLMALRRPQEALARLDSLPAATRNANTHFVRGIVLSALGRPDEALASYRAVIAMQPAHVDALFNAGNILAERARYDEAIDCYDKILARVPQHVDVLNNRGLAQLRLGRADDALESFSRLLALRPADVRALTNRALALKKLRRFEEALVDFGRVIATDPRYCDALFNRGNTLIDLGRPREAVADFDRALALRPGDPDIHSSRAHALFDLRRLDEAVAGLRRVLAINPHDATAHSSLIFALNFDAAATTAEHQAARARWAALYQPLTDAAPPHRNDRDPARRLHIGYVSPYFRHQAATYSFGGVIVSHDPEQFEITCYSDTAEEDDVTSRLRASAKWQTTANLSDDALADLIRSDGVDILIDLVGHMRGHRLAAFARKPAPIQVTAWGEPTGTGLKAIDYLFADPVLVPQAERPLLAETVFDLPNFLGFWTPEPLPDVGPLPAIARGHVTFGSFNRMSKTPDAVLRRWAAILRALPNARLVLKDLPDRVLEPASQREPVLALLAAEGIAADRVIFLGAMKRMEHFNAYRDLDIALDPFPHGGGMTTLDALWMGVPVVTAPGRTISSRLAAASLSNLGLEDFVAADAESYVDLAIAKARDLDALASLRAGLRQRIVQSEIGDPARYAHAVEAAYRTMWRQWCALSRP